MKLAEEKLKKGVTIPHFSRIASKIFGINGGDKKGKRQKAASCFVLPC
jgi:hypothetical protein